MRDRRDNDGRVSKRSSTGIRRDGTAEKREPIRSFEESDGIYRDDGRRASGAPRRDRRDDRRDDRYDDRRYDDRDDRRRQERRDDRYYDDRRDDRYYDDHRDDRRRDYGRDERDYDTMRRSTRREAPRWDEYRFDDEDDRDPREERRDDRDDRDDRRDPRKKQETRRAPARRVGGDTELFVHQIVPYAMFWIALFAAVSFILRDLVGLGGSAGAFGSWLADALGGLMGPVAYLLPLWLVVLSLRWKTYVREGLLFKKLLLSAAFLWLLSGIVHVFQDGALRNTLNTEGLYASGALLESGGLLGGFLGEWMGYILYLWGTVLLAIPLLLIIGIYLIGMTPGGIWQRISCKFKMASTRRAERRRELYDGDEERTLRVKGKEAHRLAEGSDGPEQAPAEERTHYTFGAEEDDFAPRRDYENLLKVEPEEETTYAAPEAPTPETETAIPEAPAPAAEREPASRVHSATDIVDIPEDLPEIDEPVNDLQAILQGAGHHESAEDKLDQILREAAERSEQEARAKAEAEVARRATEQTAAEEEERPLQGTSYSPFALHQHFEPKPVKSAEPTPAQPAAQTDRGSYLTEESLGALNPIHREQRSSVETPAVTPAEEVLAYRPAPAVAHEAPSTERVTYAPVQETPYTAPLASELIIENEPASVVAEPAVRPAFAQPTPAVAEPAPAVEEAPRSVGGFSLAAEEPVAPEVAVGTHTSFGFAEEEPEAPAAEPAVAFVREEVPAAPEQPAAPQHPAMPDRPRTVPVQPKARVLTRTEPVKEEPKPTPPPPPREYRLPHMELLKEDLSIKENDHSEEIAERIETLRATLKSFNIRVKDEVTCSRGPTITRYELRPEPGVSVRSVMNRMDDISLNMAAPVRIEAPIPGKPAIGIEVPNAEREMVFMRTLLESDLYKNSKKPLEVPLGLDVGGDIIMCDLAKMPHLLVAGSTGSGKSVCINTILISLMYKTTPNDLRLILIDPKQVEFTSYNHIPHLYAPIVTDSARAVGVLACAVQEMERRYSLIKDVGVRNIEGYNEATKNDPEREHLPYMVIVIDEFADLKMACTNNDVETFTCRLAQKARAAGMHLIIGTQRPTVNVITGNLKNNIPSRIAFKVTQQTDSRTILDANGAESLIGRGDMLYMTAGLPKPARMQGAFVSDEEVESVATYVRDHNPEVQYNQAFMDQIEAEMARAANAGRKDEDMDDFADDGDDEDPKFREAVELAIETQKVATSLLQRRLGVGYGRAAKIIDRMEALGYVSAPEGNKARKVLITHAQFAAGELDGEGEYADENY